MVFKINSAELANEKYLGKIYTKLGLVTSGIDLLIDCTKIANNSKYSEEKKNQEITKKLAGDATSTYAGLKGAKYISKLISILKKRTPNGIVCGFAIDCALFYYLGKTSDDITEELLQKYLIFLNKYIIYYPINKVLYS